MFQLLVIRLLYASNTSSVVLSVAVGDSPVYLKVPLVTPESSKSIIMLFNEDTVILELLTST